MTNHPHILYITADELRCDAITPFGCQAIATPHLARLADEGITFDAAYTASHLCLPSRCAMLTGLYPHRSGAYSNFRDCALAPAVPNLYNTLLHGGYTTAHIGKCHYAPMPYHLMRADATPELAQLREYYVSLGIDNLLLQDGKWGSASFLDDYSRELADAGYLDAYREACWNKELARVFTFPGPTCWHPDAWVGRKSVELLQTLSPEKPSFTWVSFSGPHYPTDPPAEYLARVDPEKVGMGSWQEGEFDDPRKIQFEGFNGGDGEGAEGRDVAPGRACKNFTDEYWRRQRQYYYANVVLIDDCIGDILIAAEARFGDNLLVLFTSDHGDMLGNHRLSAKNRCAYEDVLQVPLIARGAGFPTHQRSDARVSLLDILPTCLRVAGVPLPGRMDGRDLRESLADGGYEYIITEAERFITIQDQRYKYIRAGSDEDVRCELYDLQTDPHEFDNLAYDPACAGEIARLQGQLLEHFTGTVLR